MSRKPELLLQDILNSSKAILDYTNGYTFEKFNSDSKTKDAVVRNFEIIGEAMKHLSDNIFSNYPNVHKKQISSMRDILIHEYFGVDYYLVWGVIVDELPNFIQSIEKIQNNLKSEY